MNIFTKMMFGFPKRKSDRRLFESKGSALLSICTPRNFSDTLFFINLKIGLSAAVLPGNNKLIMKE